MVACEVLASVYILKHVVHFSVSGVVSNLHVVLIMDCTNDNFSMNCESNPAFFKQCSVQWLDGWTRESMVKVLLELLNFHHCHVISMFFSSTQMCISTYCFLDSYTVHRQQSSGGNVTSPQ